MNDYASKDLLSYPDFAAPSYRQWNAYNDSEGISYYEYTLQKNVQYLRDINCCIEKGTNCEQYKNELDNLGEATCQANTACDERLEGYYDMDYRGC